MSRYSKSAASYSDVKKLFDTALLKGRVFLRFSDKAKATTFAGRANAFRCLLREQEAAAGREYASPYDHLMVRRPSADRTSVVLEPRGYDFEAFDEQGNPIVLDKKTADAPALTPHERTLTERDSSFLDDFMRGVEK